MNTDDFEKTLRRQPMRELPGAWRADILREARLATETRRVPWLEWLWPRPVAWAGLAAAWALIAILHALTPTAPRGDARRTAPPDFTLIRQLAEQRRELLKPLDENIPPATPRAPGRQSECGRQIWAA